MSGLFQKIYGWLIGLFWLTGISISRATELNITIVGLQNAGKTSLIKVLTGDEFTVESTPTVGFSLKRVTKGHVTIRFWDVGGQTRFRTIWERYCRGVNAILFVVDCSDPTSLSDAKEELHCLMDYPSLTGIPLLLLGNKTDLGEALSVDQLIEALDIANICHREVSCYGISVKEDTNLDAVLNWLVARANK
ncbi:ADP-ribosylation factor-like protein 8B-A [Golovinomyces cichoracearum]|uniref:ADP-ribosylation factor-like protein 8B-A n=1 Tax=Golovinomyces cichoracearum TaxID=62708 RepID=A0A420HDY7_9PEZI|nr:ADP-ribosylation factor-like protein 8B-A [Golovinomyces cichoracearum]